MALYILLFFFYLLFSETIRVFSNQIICLTLKDIIVLKENSKIISGFHQALDLLLISLSFQVSFYIKTNLLPERLAGLAYENLYSFAFIIALICFHIGLRLFGAYDPFRNLSKIPIVSRIFKASLTSMTGIVFITYLLHMNGISRLFLAIFIFITFCLLALFKITVFNILSYNRKRNYNTRNILIIGSRQRAQDFIQKVLEVPGSGYRILGCLETTESQMHIGDTVISDIKIIGKLDSFQTLLKETTVDEVIFALPLKKVENIHDYIYFAEKMGINIKILPDFQLHRIKYLPNTATVSLHQFMGTPTLCLSSLPTKGTELIIKDFIDYIGAGAGLLLLSPLLLLISIFIKLTSKGPVFFSQPRVGVNGRLFDMYKFRTMVVNAEELKAQLAEKNEVDGPVFKIQNDPRITPVGKFLRKTSLDELPQLFNVIRGEMSLVGPRPPVPSEVLHYELWQRRRLSMKPGLTCIWQVSGRNNISFEQWMNMDLEYIDNWSLWLDIKLLFKTVREVTVGGGR